MLPAGAMAVKIYNLCNFYRKERKVKATTSLRTLRPSR